jgi:beta-glucosidase
VAAMNQPIYRDPARPIEQRCDDLLERMTDEELIGQMVQLPGHFAGTTEACAAAHCGSILCVVGEQVRPAQEAALATRLGIPLIVGIDAIHGHSMWHGAVMFPSQLGLSCAWDADLCRRVARATARQVCATGIHWTFSPVLCLPRDLRWGRVNETFGEDALLIGQLGAAMIHGYQGDDLAAPDAIAACAKHFIGYGESEGGRDASDSGHSMRTLRAVFLPPFAAAARAGVATWMTAYHAVDGTPVVFNRTLLTGVLRDELGSDGLVVTDWDVLGRMVRDRRVAPDLADSSARAVAAGNDMIMNTPGFHAAALANLAAGRTSRDQLRQAVRRVLMLKFRLGLFEDPRLPDEPRAMALCSEPMQRALAIEAARAALVLLKNRNGVLPLDAARAPRIAVLGPNADDVLSQLGDWSLGAGQAQGQRDQYPRSATATVLDGLRQRFGAAAVTHATGCGVPAPRGTGSPVRYDAHAIGDGQNEAAPARIARAVRLAEAAEVAVLVLGDQIAYVGEMKSTATLELPGEQMALFRAVRATGTPLIVVLLCSKPLAIPEIARDADAILLAHNPGMAGGTAIAEALAGDVNPSGRLTLSWPHHVGQQPVRYDLMPGAHQGGYPDLPGAGFDALFPFGFGLSYTTVRYHRLVLGAATVAAGGRLRASVTLANTGDRETTETVQLYLSDRCTSVSWPGKRLVGWRRLVLPAGVSTTIVFELGWDELALFDCDGRWTVEPGEFELLAGGNSRDLLRAPFSAVG